jgi:hypothetical protein
MAGAPEGNQNSTREKRMLTSILKRELIQRPEDALAIVNKMITAAIAGEPWAVKEIFDRAEGKPKQPVVGGDDDDSPLKVVHKIERVIRRADVANRNG